MVSWVPASIRRAMPKSSTLACTPRMPRRIMMFSGFRSRWMTPLSCALASTSATCSTISMASISGSRPCSAMTFLRSTPSQYSMAMKRLPSSSCPKSCKRHGVGVRHARVALGLVEEAAGDLGVGGELGLEELERDPVADAQLLGEVDGAHAALPQLADDLELALDDPVDHAIGLLGARRMVSVVPHWGHLPSHAACSAPQP